MRILIIPDIHNKWIEAEQIIDKQEHDKIIFLGDYFDSFDNSPEIAYQTAQWLKNSLSKPNRIHLIGNHDLSYKTNGNNYCSGWNGVKQMFIDKVGINWKSLYHYCWCGDWLCTHAGLSNEFYKAHSKKDEDVNDFLHRYSTDSELVKRLYDCSPFRGGFSLGGIVWCDWEEFEPIPDVKQIFGHTHNETFRRNGTNICLDTWLKYYAIYDTNTLEMNIYETKQLKR